MCFKISFYKRKRKDNPKPMSEWKKVNPSESGKSKKESQTQVRVEGEETVEEMLQYGKLCERVICYFFLSPFFYLFVWVINYLLSLFFII